VQLNVFAFRLLQMMEAAGEERGDNLLVSPLSASIVLGMLDDGANLRRYPPDGRCPESLGFSGGWRRR
jgi:hypothetical protein